MTVAGLHAVDEQLRRAADQEGSPRGSAEGVGAGSGAARGSGGDLRSAELLYVDAGRGRGPLVARARQLGVTVRRVSAKQLDDVACREAFPASAATPSTPGRGAAGQGPRARHDGILLRLASRATGGSRRERGGGAPGPEARRDGAHHRDAASVRERLRRLLAEYAGSELLVLALDGITDPMNVGSILRSADQFGAALVLLPRRRSAPISATVHRASAGAAAHVDVLEVPNLDQALGELRRHEVWIYGADMSGEPVSAVSVARQAALVLGAEGSGLHRLTRDRCDRLVRVPTQGAVDSLNVGVAAGVLMYEMRRQWAAEEGR